MLVSADYEKALNSNKHETIKMFNVCHMDYIYILYLQYFYKYIIVNVSYLLKFFLSIELEDLGININENNLNRFRFADLRLFKHD